MILEQNTKHGTTSSYNNGCRCSRCKMAKATFRRETPIKGHGTKWYYDKGCRCDLCIDAKMAYRRKLHPNTHRKVTTDLVSMTRTCYSCHETKSLDEFGRNKNRRASMGRSHECRVCHNKRSKDHKNTPEHRFATYKSGARVRKISFELSFEEFISFWNKPCFYCEEEIMGIGLDRKDSTGSYCIENVLPCCGQCNYAKKSQTTDQFISMCLKVAKKFESYIVPPAQSTTTLRENGL